MIVRILRFLTPTGWVVAVVIALAVAGWVKAWYFPVVQVRTVEKRVEVPVIKYRTKVVTREIRVVEPPKEVEEKLKPGEQLIARGIIPPAPRGGIADAVVGPDGVGKIYFEPKPKPFIEIGGIREVSIWAGLNDYSVAYRQDLGRIGPAHVMVRGEIESRRGNIEWKAQVGVGVRF